MRIVAAGTGFLIAAGVIRHFQLWSPVANSSIPWLASATALALFGLAAQSALLGAPLSRWSARQAYGPPLLLSAMAGSAVLVDRNEYLPHGGLVNLLEIAGFAVLYLGLLFLLRASPSKTD